MPRPRAHSSPARTRIWCNHLAALSQQRSVGHLLLVWDEAGATVHYGERKYNVPVLEDSVPIDLWRTDVLDHIQANGYWAVLDLRALIA